MNSKLENSSLKFELIIPTKKDIKNSCGNEIQLRMFLKLLNHKNLSNEISGLWSIINCSSCKQLAFQQ